MTSDLLTVDPTLKPYKRVKENEKNAKSHMHTTHEVEHPWWQEWLNVVDKQKCAKVTNTALVAECVLKCCLMCAVWCNHITVQSAEEGRPGYKATQ